jgi:uncharacterized protein YdeI (YjbR/CyaY-like superfamily)
LFDKLYFLQCFCALEISRLLVDFQKLRQFYWLSKSNAWKSNFKISNVFFISDYKIQKPCKGSRSIKLFHESLENITLIYSWQVKNPLSQNRRRKLFQSQFIIARVKKNEQINRTIKILSNETALKRGLASKVK